MTPDGYHQQGGWYFKRLEDGSVRIRWQPGSTSGDVEPEVLVEQTIPANEWASIVCAVSAGGEDAERFARAMVFHGGPS